MLLGHFFSPSRSIELGVIPTTGTAPGPPQTCPVQCPGWTNAPKPFRTSELAMPQ